jgi:uncharacterized membrane protein
LSQIQIKLVVDARDVMCHCAQVQNKNLALHSPELIRQDALSVLQLVNVLCQAVSDTPNNVSQITKAERGNIKHRYETGAPSK